MATIKVALQVIVEISVDDDLTRDEAHELACEKALDLSWAELASATIDEGVTLLDSWDDDGIYDDDGHYQGDEDESDAD